MDAICLGVGALFAALGLLSAWRQGRAARARWGHVRRATDPKGPGAFREASLTEERPRGVPAAVWVAGALGRVFAFVGPIVGAPMLVLVGLSSAASPEYGRPGLALVAMVGAVAMLAHAGFTGGAASALLRCERRAGERARTVGLGTMTASVIVLGGLWLGEGVGDARGAVAASVVVASALVGAALAFAGARVDAIQRAMTDEEWDALPLGE